MTSKDQDYAPRSRALNLDAVPLAFADWLARDLPPPDRLMGEWLTTTSRVLMNAPTGLGKTNLIMALFASAAAGRNFLHWRAHRAARALFIDGEMSRRLLLQRAQDVSRRLGIEPKTLFLLSHEDIEDFQPLNTPAGRAVVEAVIEKVGGVDLIGFDNIMSLIGGDMKEEEGWARVLPFMASLTKRSIGQLWAHHTGHDATKGYGTKTREWRMDTVVHLTEQQRADTDISFLLEFRKARERTPETRRDFEDVSIALVNDEWVHSAGTKQTQLTPTGAKFLEALYDALASDNTVRFQSWPAVKLDQWHALPSCGLVLRPIMPAEKQPLPSPQVIARTTETNRNRAETADFIGFRLSETVRNRLGETVRNRGETAVKPHRNRFPGTCETAFGCVYRHPKRFRYPPEVSVSACRDDFVGPG